MTNSNKERIYELSRIFKGVANHWRIAIIFLLAKKPELSVSEISEMLKVDIKTLSEHLRKLLLAGLIMKRYEGNFVRHALTARGRSILKFCRIME